MVHDTLGAIVLSRPSSACNVCPTRSETAGRCIWPERNGRVDAVARQVEFLPNRHVIDEGTQSGAVWIVQKGLLRIQRFSFDGRRQILSLVLPGELAGYDLQGREGISVETATDCVLCQVDRRLFDARMDSSSDLRRATYLQQTNQLDRLRWLTWALGALKPEERTAAFLALATRFMPYQPLPDGSGILSMQISRLDMADLLGTTVESISRITRRLQRDGVLAVRRRGQFQILDLCELIELGCIETTFRNLPFGQPPAEVTTRSCLEKREGLLARLARTMAVVNEPNRPVAISGA